MPWSRRAIGATSASLIAAGLVIASPAAQAAQNAAPPDDANTAKTLVIGIDGASYDFMAPSDMPNLTALRTAGLTASSNLYAQPMAGTNSGPGWSSIATGVWPDKHNVVDNAFTDPHYDQYPDYLTRIEAATPDSETLVVGTWAPVPEQVFGPDVDQRVAGGNDAGTAAKVVEQLATADPDNVFVHLDEVDGAGHSVGTDGPAYAAALQRADAQIGEMLTAIRGRATYDAENWLVVVTSDHGHRPTGGHGGNTAAERKTFVIAAGHGIPAGSTRHDVKLVDIAPLVLHANGIDVTSEWDLDGVPLDALEPDAFDTLRGSLRTRVDESSPPADLLGWTDSAPDGWRIDNSRMPEGGVTEWRGWSFATDDFWTAAEPGQLREASVRNRDVFAVADSDEWDDKSHAAGQFDSTLISPAWDLNGAATATLSYATHYFVDGPQSAEVLVSFDGGEPASLKNYRIDTNRFERLEFDVPAGARTAEFSFHYTGNNSAFWTIDQVRLDQGEPPARPRAPTGLTATAGDAKIRVAWAAPESATGVTGYTATATPLGDATLRATAPLCTTESTTCDITGLTNGQSYRISVLAHSAVGDSDATVLESPVTPVAAPTGGDGDGDGDSGGDGGLGDGDGGSGDGGSGDGGSGSVGAPAAGDGAGTASGADGILAETGADPMPLLLGGGVILAAGAALTVVGLRRRGRGAAED